MTSPSATAIKRLKAMTHGAATWSPVVAPSPSGGKSHSVGNSPPPQTKAGWFLQPPGYSLEDLDHLLNTVLGECGLGPSIPADLFRAAVQLESMYIAEDLAELQTTLRWLTGWELGVVQLQSLRLELRYSPARRVAATWETYTKAPTVTATKIPGLSVETNTGSRKVVKGHASYLFTPGYRRRLSGVVKIGELATMLVGIEMPAGTLSAELAESDVSGARALLVLLLQKASAGSTNSPSPSGGNTSTCRRRSVQATPLRPPKTS